MKSSGCFAAIFSLFILCSSAQASDDSQALFPAGSRPSAYANHENFIGHVRVDPGFQSREPARSYGAYVTFEPEARTNWHIHPLGQTLIVTSGKGIIQEWGKHPTIIRQGDIVVCPPGVKHWHGAAPDTAMTHLAISEWAEGMTTKWLEKVVDDDYQDAAKFGGK